MGLEKSDQLPLLLTCGLVGYPEVVPRRLRAAAVARDL